MKLTLAGDTEDIDITITRIGRRILITTPRSGVAQSMQRRMVDVYTEPKSKESLIGFHADEE